MSAILSASDLNDFISPSVACIKPVETLPATSTLPAPISSDGYEVTTEDTVAANNGPAAPAQISLTDCLACSGCVTSAEAVLVSLQSYQEILTTLDAYASLPIPSDGDDEEAWREAGRGDGKVFVASVSPQARASVAATFGVSTRAAGNMIARLLVGEEGLRAGGRKGSGFAWVLDTEALGEVTLVGAAEEVADATTRTGENGGDFTDPKDRPRKPVLASACPGWICYAEKTHPHVLPHVSKLKSPQALAGTLVKSVLARRGIGPDKVFHVAVMPCFDKKLEASRAELMSGAWEGGGGGGAQDREVRDVDMVITARELVSLATTRGIRFPELSTRPVKQQQQHPFPFPDEELGRRYLFAGGRRRGGRKRRKGVHDDDDDDDDDDAETGREAAGTSGGYLTHILRSAQSQLPGSEIVTRRGRNADVIEYALRDGDRVAMRAARYYGFRNIQNLVRRLRPARESRMPGVAAAARRPGRAVAAGRKDDGADSGVEGYDYVEVMACPGGCTNGGGQIKVGDAVELRAEMGMGLDEGNVTGLGAGGQLAQKEWLAKVDEAYWSGGSEDEDEDEDEPEGQAGMGDDGVVDGVSKGEVRRFLQRWSEYTGVPIDRLLYTTYRKVESDVGKKGSDVERVAGLASSIGGGW